MSELSWMDRVKFLLARGTEISLNEEPISDENANDAVELLLFAANKSPKFLLREIVMSGGSEMMSLALAVLFARADDKFISKNYVKDVSFEMLVFKDPPIILEFVEYLRSKQLGRGFGSRPQKLVRKVMESWPTETMENYISKYKKETKKLVILVHPRYKNYHSELIRLLMDKNL